MTTPRLLRVIALAVAPLLLALPGPAAAHQRAELEQMLAPIALYPDSVLSHVLIAATYPEDVAAAARWSSRHPDLHGKEAVDAVEGRAWDPSVKALVAFPELLARMDENPDWTEDLGDAFLEHEAEVMDSVQALRDHAYDAGHLRSSEHVRVIREREYIYIEPAVHHVIYVPYYDPWYVYGSWRWSSYPPYRWRHWHGHAVSYYGSGFHWGVGFRIAPTFYFTSFYWPERYVVVTHYRHTSYRPLYSGRHVTREREVRHWREQRPVRTDAPRPRSERRDERNPAASSRPQAHPGRGADMRRPRLQGRDDAQGSTVWRPAPSGESRRDEPGSARGSSRDEREVRREEAGSRRQAAPQRRSGEPQRPAAIRREAVEGERDRRREPAEAEPQGQRPAPARGPERPAERGVESRPNGDNDGNTRGRGREEGSERDDGRQDGSARGKRDERAQRGAARSRDR